METAEKREMEYLLLPSPEMVQQSYLMCRCEGLRYPEQGAEESEKDERFCEKVNLKH